MNIARSSVLLLLLIMEFASAAEGYHLEVVVSGADSSSGSMMVSLFNSAETYLEQPLSDANAFVDANGEVHIDFGIQQPGEYAVVVVYDENNNGKLDKNFLGIPIEKIGYSNNAKSMFGPANWGATSFTIKSADVSVKIAIANVKPE